MKKFMKCFMALCFAAAFLQQAPAENLTGKAIAQKARDTNKSGIGMVVKGTLVLKNMKSNSIENRSFVTLSSRSGELSRSLFRFTSSSYSGTTFLTIERRSSDNLQYLFLKSIGSPRQVESSDKEKNFVDTDLSNEDMGGGKVIDYTYKRLGDRTVKGKECYVIEKYPKRKNSKYSRHLIIIDKATFVPIASKGYNRAGRVVKTMKAGNIRKIGSVHVPWSVMVTDITKRHRTTMKVSFAAEQRSSRGYFNKNRLKMRWSVQ